MAVKHASVTDISISVAWVPQNDDPTRITPTWTWNDKTGARLPTSLNAGRIDMSLMSRPAKQQILALRYKGSGNSISLIDSNGDRYGSIPAQKPLTTTVTTAKSGNLPSGSCKKLQQLVPPLCMRSYEPADWKIVSHNFQLSGNRSCAAYAHCEKTREDAGKICYRFQMQGHDEECNWNNDNTGEHRFQKEILSASLATSITGEPRGNLTPSLYGWSWFCLTKSKSPDEKYAPRNQGFANPISPSDGAPAWSCPCVPGATPPAPHSPRPSQRLSGAGEPRREGGAEGRAPA